MDRLEVARRIEKERKIVFPETTIIIRDIQKLMAALRRADEVASESDEVFAGVGEIDLADRL